MQYKTSEDRELAEQLVVAEAKLMSQRETEQLVAIARITRFLACYNANQQLDITGSGALTIPKALLSQLCLGFAKDSFGRAVLCVLFQDYLWQDIQHIPLQLAVVEADERILLLRFSDLPIMDFKIPHLDIALPILSDTVWAMLQDPNQLRFITVGKIERNMQSRKFSCTATHANPKKIIQGFNGVYS